jgi:phage-related protein
MLKRLMRLKEKIKHFCHFLSEHSHYHIFQFYQPTITHNLFTKLMAITQQHTIQENNNKPNVCVVSCYE